MHPEVLAYIKRINDKDKKLSEIELRDLELDYSDISELMDTLDANQSVAKQIISIDLDGNNLERFPIPLLVNLEELRLSDNQIQNFEVRPELVNLKFLKFAGNGCQTIKFPVSMPNFDFLNLEGNSFEKVPLPEDAPNLEWLDLSGNIFEELTLPSWLPILKYMNLSHNCLVELDLKNRGLQMLEEMIINENQLRTLILTEAMPALHTLLIQDNELTNATKFALRAESVLRNAIRPTIISYSNQLAPEMPLTSDILEEHFAPMLNVNVEKLVQHFNDTGVESVLPYLPADLVELISSYLIVPPEIADANTSMDYFKRIFTTLDNASQLNILNSYTNRFDELVKATKQSYYEVLETLDNNIAERAKVRVDTKLHVEPRLITMIYSANKRMKIIADNTQIESARNPYQLALRGPNI